MWLGLTPSAVASNGAVAQGGQFPKGQWNSRQEAVKEYLEEFSEGSLEGVFPNIYKAIENVFRKIPAEVFDKVTNRDRPVIFTVHFTKGNGRYAQSINYTVEEDDPPTFKEGFYMIKLGDLLNNTNDVEAIEGIVYHELAHRYLEHHQLQQMTCEHEREANHLVKEWGFEKEFLKAKEKFGSKSKEDSPCFDYKDK